MSGGMWGWGFVNLTPLFTFILLAALCYLAWRQTWIVVSNENKPERTKLDKVSAIVAAVFALAVIISVSTFISTTLGDIKVYLGKNAPENVHVALKLSLGFAPILTLILTALLAALPFVPVASNMLYGFENAQPNISFGPIFEKKTKGAPKQNYASAPQAAPAPQAATAPQNAAYAAGELKQYKDLLDAGVITQADFDAKKAEILNLPKNQ